jgi:hypothetical protein
MKEHQERYDELLDRVGAAHKRLAADAAEQALAIDELRRFSEASVLDEALRLGPETSRLSRKDIARRILVSELACLLRLPDRTMETLIGVSTNLIHTLPATFAVLQAGNISYRHAAVLVDQTAGLSDENTAELERTVLGSAGQLTVSQFTQKTRKARERLDPESIPARHERSVADRALFYEPAADGMAWLSIFLPAAQAAAIYTRVTNAAMALQGPNEPRTLTQLRVDVFSDLILDTRPGEAGSGSRFTGIKPDVFLLVPALTLLGRSDEPAILERLRADRPGHRETTRREGEEFPPDPHPPRDRNIPLARAHPVQTTQRPPDPDPVAGWNLPVAELHLQCRAHRYRPLHRLGRREQRGNEPHQPRQSVSEAPRRQARDRVAVRARRERHPALDLTHGPGL